jgi:ferredoxin--NADP+ reductase
VHVITQNCCDDASCVPVCPVNCIHPTPDEPEYLTAEMLYIDPDVCIDCGACVDACPVNAISADYDLEPEQEPFIEVNAQWYRDATHNGYSNRQPTPTVRMFEPTPEALCVAVIGSGPAGCYVVDQLTSQRGINVRVNVFERLPVPGGLVRYGVAPDHEDTKTIADFLTRGLRRSAVSVFLNVEVGVDISHEELLRHHHAVVYAVGSPDSRALGVPGEDLPGSHAASEFVAWYNGHPDFVDQEFDLSCERAVVAGNGNVALDVARILTADIDDLARTDICGSALEQLAESRIREVVVLGRRGPAQASFTIAELSGMRSQRGVDLVVDPSELELDPVTQRLYAGHEHAMDLFKARLLRELPVSGRDGQRQVQLRFLLSPTQVLGDERVSGLRVVRNELVYEDGAARARPTGEEMILDCGLVLRSVGYRGRPVPGVPFDRLRCVVPNQSGRVVDADLEMPNPHLGIYVVGWAKRGPSGVIGTNKSCARETVNALLDDYVGGLLAPPIAGLDSLRSLLATTSAIGTADWKAIEEHERALGRSQSRPRVKLVTIEEMLAVASTARESVLAVKHS